jgi:uncharacterized protein (TIGR01777 family)
MCGSETCQVQVRVKGELEARWWSETFEGLLISAEPDGTTLLSGALPDQSAMHGILGAIRDLGLPIVSVETSAASGGGGSSAEATPRRVLIAGGGGLVGGAVAEELQARHEIVRLVRRAPGPAEIEWDPDAGTIDRASLDGFDAVIDLATAPWSGRWTKEWKRRMHANRVGSYRLLAEALAGVARRPRVVVFASGMGIYAPAGDAIITEESALADDFLGRLQRDGEAATAAASDAGIRVVHLRLPMVLGGASLATLTTQNRRFGTGRQWSAWIARSEVARIVEHVLSTPAVAGGVNATSPSPLRNADIVSAVSRVTGRKPGRPIPAFVLRLLLGEMADSLILASRRMAPARLLDTGFSFLYPDFEVALRHEIARASRAQDRISESAATV